MVLYDSLIDYCDWAVYLFEYIMWMISSSGSILPFYKLV